MAEPITWTFRPEWSRGIVERLEWATAVLGSIVGAEQAIATRYAPRRSVEASFLVEGNERSYFALTLDRLGSEEFRVPLWFQRAKLDASLAPGATVLPCDTLHREFRAGDHAVLMGSTAFDCETVEIAAVTDNALTLAGATVQPWNRGTVVHPLRTARLETRAMPLATSRVATGSMRFLIDSGEDIDGGAEDLPIYTGLPIFAYKPDWADEISVTFGRLLEDHDSKTGLREVADTAGRAFRTTRYGIMLHGRAQQAGFRALLRRLRGQQGALWLPSQSHDVTVAAPAVTGSNELEIERVGLVNVGGVSPEIAHLYFSDGTAMQWANLVEPAVPTNERLATSSPLPRDISTGEKAQFLQTVRLDQDVVTLTHETDSDGVATCALTFTAIDASRDGDAVGSLPIPAATMVAGGCGCENGELLASDATMPVDNGAVWRSESWALEASAGSTPRPLRMYRPFYGYPGTSLADRYFPEITGYAGNWYTWDTEPHPADPNPNYPYPNSDESTGLTSTRDEAGNWSGGFDANGFAARYAPLDETTYWEGAFVRKRRVRNFNFSGSAGLWVNEVPDQEGSYTISATDYTEWYWPSYDGSSGSVDGTIIVNDMSNVAAVEITDPTGYQAEVQTATDESAVILYGTHGEFRVLQVAPGSFYWEYVLWGDLIFESVTDSFEVRLRYDDGTYSEVTPETTATVTLQV